MTLSPIHFDRYRPAPLEPVTGTVRARLRQELRRLEAGQAALEAAPRIPFGLGAIDAVLGGGLASGALHEIAAARETALPPATGFLLALASRASPAKSIVWVAEDLARAESGLPYGPGLDDFGIPPERVLVVTGAKDRDVLWVMEESLRCAGVGAVIGELRGLRGIDLTGTRRLSLAAAAGGALALILRGAPGDEASAADTRWEIAAVPSRLDRYGIGPPRFEARLRRNRHGSPGAWILEWHRDTQCFSVAADSQLVVASPVERPHRAARVA